MLECVRQWAMSTTFACGSKDSITLDNYTRAHERWPGPFVDVSVSGEFGEFGYAVHANGTVLDLDRGTAVVGPTKILQLTASVGHTRALSQDGRVWCWGDNGEGQLGNGTQQDRSSTEASLVLGPKGSRSTTRSEENRDRVPRPQRSRRQPNVGAPPRMCPPVAL